MMSHVPGSPATPKKLAKGPLALPGRGVQGYVKPLPLSPSLFRSPYPGERPTGGWEREGTAVTEQGRGPPTRWRPSPTPGSPWFERSSLIKRDSRDIHLREDAHHRYLVICLFRARTPILLLKPSWCKSRRGVITLCVLSPLLLQYCIVDAEMAAVSELEKSIPDMRQTTVNIRSTELHGCKSMLPGVISIMLKLKEVAYWKIGLALSSN